jgi:hypothetical protein
VIAVAIVCVVAAAGLLVAGLVMDSPTLYYSSIAASALAALALLMGVRGMPVAQLAEDDFDVGRTGPDVGRRPRPDREPAQRAATALLEEDRARLESAADPTQPGGRAGGVPQDEPPAEIVTAAQARAVAQLMAEVGVIDGRPRYHLDGCLHLLGRTVERLPVLEAVELGFTPCGQCAPVRALLPPRL